MQLLWQLSSSRLVKWTLKKLFDLFSSRSSHFKSMIVMSQRRFVQTCLSDVFVNALVFHEAFDEKKNLFVNWDDADLWRLLSWQLDQSSSFVDNVVNRSSFVFRDRVVQDIANDFSRDREMSLTNIAKSLFIVVLVDASRYALSFVLASDNLWKSHNIARLKKIWDIANLKQTIRYKYKFISLE